MKYQDKLQFQLEALALDKIAREEKTKIFWGDTKIDTEIGFIMLGFNLFYDEAKERWKQALNLIKKQNNIKRSYIKTKQK